MEQSAVKSDRILKMYSRLVNGETLNKEKLAEEYHVNQRSIQRDIESLRCFLSEQMLNQDIVYDRAQKGFKLVNTIPHGLTNSEILVVCKILLDSRSLRKDEMFPILDKLIDAVVPVESKKAVKDLVANEKYHYIEPHHGKHIIDGFWNLGEAIKQQNIIEIEYERMKEPSLVKRRVQPVGIMFNEYYFYLAAFLEDKSSFENPDDIFPTIYRLDRIHSLMVTNEHFNVPYQDRFQEGEFRKRVQFMYGGQLMKIRFIYKGPSVEAVLDRLPTAVIIKEEVHSWVIEAEVFGKGIDMWLRSQGENIEVLDRQIISTSNNKH